MGATIRGILTVVPSRTRRNDDLTARFGQAAAERCTQMTGVDEVHLVSTGQTCADLAERAAASLLAKLGMSAGEVDGLVFLTQTPDYLMPATACILQDRLGLPKQSLAFDVNLGCSAYPYGLAIAYGLIAAGLARRILILAGDALSLRVHPEDRATFPLFGDAATATLLEADVKRNDLLGADLGTDGSGWANLVLPVGQCRCRSVDELSETAPQELKAVEHPAHVFMDGNAIFAFTLREVPGIVERTLRNASEDRNAVDYFFLHQANRFILDHLVRKMDLPREKCPMSITCYGNTSGASPAVTACHSISAVNRDRDLTAMFVGFGIGYSWGGMLVRLRPGTVFPVEECN
jgi:3-oxoacyl-[acyl-carrier-protein] synthase-3